MGKPTVAIIGATADRSRYGNKSVRAHLAAGYEVYPVNVSGESVEGLPGYSSIRDVPVSPLDRVSLYVRPGIVATLLDDIAEQGCMELYFNPGTQNDEVLARAEELGLNPVEGCSIIDVGFSPAQFPST